MLRLPPSPSCLEYLELDFEQARFNMVEQQIRTWEVLDQAVLDSLVRIHREDFVPSQYKSLAFIDMEIPLGHGEVMLAPKLQARLIQEAELLPDDSVLEVGTGSGYMTALLASRSRHVFSVDIVGEFTAQARPKLAAHGITNVTLESGDAARGWASHAPYDVILLTGSVPRLMPELERTLNPGGRLVAIVGDPPVMTARRIRRVDDAAFSREGLFETCIKALRNAPQPERFVF
jgi:protein-L-isoaspartate(D-aspartate) O-methyltransferase